MLTCHVIDLFVPDVSHIRVVDGNTPALQNIHRRFKSEAPSGRNVYDTNMYYIEDTHIGMKKLHHTLDLHISGARI